MAGVDEVAVGGIDEEQLLLEADRERLALAEVQLFVVLSHADCGVPAAAGDQPSPAANWTIDESISHSTGATSSV